MTRKLVLASASPARLRLLRDAGIEPRVIVSGVDEDAIIRGVDEDAIVSGVDEDAIIRGVDEDAIASGDDGAAPLTDDPHELVTVLAIAKAAAVANDIDDGSLVLGCDSMLEFYGEVLGKPGTPEAATERWHRMRGKTGRLLTGHCVIDTDTSKQATEVGETVVHFGTPTDAEINSYVATGEPLHVAGAFTLDGHAAPFIDGIEGDASNVIGLSLPTLRRLLATLGVGITELWSEQH